MSADNPTSDELRYLASLEVVRSDGFDRTSPALARALITADKVIEEARSVCRAWPDTLSFGKDGTSIGYLRLALAAYDAAITPKDET